VLGPACNQYNKLTDELEIERACRNEAEKFATQVRGAKPDQWARNVIGRITSHCEHELSWLIFTARIVCGAGSV